MTVSVEVITMLASAATILVALVSGFGWMVTRMDARFAQQDTKFESRFTQVDARFDRLEGRIDELTHEMGEVKIAIARLEGPTPRLITSR